jgi:hypothetical protein
MSITPLPGPKARPHEQVPPSSISLRDIVQALCSGLTPSSEGLELVLDRIERTQ